MNPIHPDFKITRLEPVDANGLTMNLTLERKFEDGGSVMLELDGLSLTATLIEGKTFSNQPCDLTAELKFKLARGVLRVGSPGKSPSQIPVACG